MDSLTMFIIPGYSNENVRALLIEILVMFLYIGRPLMNVTVDLFNQTSDNGNFSMHGHFLKITVCHESHNRSGEVQNVDDCAGRADNSIVADDASHWCEDFTDKIPVITYGVIRVIHIALMVLGFVLVLMSAARLGKLKNIPFEALVTLGFCIECILFVCYILFATLFGKSSGFSTSDLTPFFYSTTVMTACLLTLSYCTLSLSVVSWRKLHRGNDDIDKGIKPLMEAYKI